MSIFKQRIKNSCSCVILAAGSSERFGEDKLLTELCGVPVIAYSISAFQYSDCVKEIVLVTAEDKLMEFAKLCDENGYYKVTKIVIGGNTRLESALSGASECNPNARLIAVHDGARPLVSVDVIDNAITCALAHNAAVPAIPSKDTIKIVKDGKVLETPDRASVYQIQTPQVFLPEILKGALTNALRNELTITDDASAAELLGFPVYLSEGSEENIKITTPLDIKLAEAILSERKRRWEERK